MADSRKVIGVDGWRGRWVAVSLLNGALDQIAIYDRLAELTQLEEPAIIGIDVPIGLVEQPPREADVLARSLLGPRRSSVFDPPPAFCLDPSWHSYRAANATAKDRSGRGISAQSFALMGHIRQAEEISLQDDRIYEILPELSFLAMNDGTPLDYAKKTWDGQSARVSLLEKQGICLPKTLGGTLGKIPPDDLLDACAVAWSADRIAQHTATALPDSQSRRQRIWF